MSQSSDPPSNSMESKESSENTSIEYNVGDYVELQGKKNTRKGYIRFKGKTKVFGECFGVELDEKIDDGNNGTLNDEKYFECEQGKGKFIKTAKIIQKLSPPNVKPKNGTNIINTNIESKEDNSSTNQSNESKESKEDNESFPAAPQVIEKSEEDQIKSKPKKKKRKKKDKASNSSKDLKRGNKKSNSSNNLKKGGKKTASSRKSNGSSKRVTSASKKKINKEKKKEELKIPKTGTNKDKLKFVYSKINAVKLPFKKRIQIIQNTIPIIQDEKCDDTTAKYAVEGYKKCFVAQLTDRKKSVHIEAFLLLDAMIQSLTKPFKQQILHYLKHTMSYLEKADNKTSGHAESTIKLIIDKCLVKDNKSLGTVIAELIRFGCSAKNKLSRKNGWKFLSIILKKHEPKKGGGKKKTKKPPKAVLDALQTGLKQGLADSDKATQKEAMNVLKSMSLIDEARGERIMARLSPAARRNFDKLIGRKGRTTSITMTKPLIKIKPKKIKKVNKKVSKKPPKKEATATSPTKGGSKKLSKRGSAKLSRASSKSKENVKDTKGKKEKSKKKSKGKKTKGDKTKATDKGGTAAADKTGAGTDKNKTAAVVAAAAAAAATPGKDDDSKTQSDKVDTITSAVDVDVDVTVKNESDNLSTDTSDKTATVTVADTNTNTANVDNVNNNNNVSDANSKEISESTTTEAYIKAEAETEVKKQEIDTEIENVDQNHNTEDSVEIDDNSIDAYEQEQDQEPDNDEYEADSSDEDSDSSSDGGDDIIGGQSSENDARDLIESFLDLKDPQINWKMIEFLSKDNMTHLLMSYISRMPQGPKIWQENLEIDMSSSIPQTKALFSKESSEIRATQLSYSLMRILSNEHCAETVKSFLLRKCQEICLHALAVFHPLSVGNVYHGRVVLEILLNHWPKSFMAALANQRHIQSLLKCALFRNLHQGNLNSFFLDLICFRPNTKIGQIQPVKKKLISMFVEWKFMQYLLNVSTTDQHGDDIATKYATFFIDMVARCASISEAADLFLGFEHLIIDSFMAGLLSDNLSIWHRISCGQTLVQFLDISSRPTIMDPASAMAGMLGVVAPDPMTNILHPMFEKSLSRLHTFIPAMCDTITQKVTNLKIKSLQLASGPIPQPLGQVKLNCLELLTVSADFAQFKCGNVLGLLPFEFWSELLNMAFTHNQNNMYLCHFRRLIHLSMIFRRRFLKHLFVTDQLLERFVDYYQNKPQPRTTLHGYILQMLWDIYNHDQRDEDEDDDDDDDDDDEKNDDDDEEEQEEEQRDSVVINDDLPTQAIGDDDENNENNETDENENENNENDDDDDEFGDDVVLKPNFSKEVEDQWDIVAFFNNNQVWKQFIVTVSLQMEAQNATETQVPNMNVANNQQQLDQLLQNLLGPTNEENSDSSDSDSDSDED